MLYGEPDPVPYMDMYVPFMYEDMADAVVDEGEYMPLMSYLEYREDGEEDMWELPYGDWLYMLAVS